MFVGRESELAELERRWASGRFEFGVVYGTRRIGKTTMLQEFIKGKRAFYYQARKADEKDNLTAFSREYRRFRGMDEHVRYDTFADAFESIATDARSQRMILIIDEIAYLCQKNQSLLSLLQFFVDGAFRQAQLILILSGSNVSFMEEILNNRNDPLYQRATFQIHLEKMPFHEAKTFVEDRTIEEQVQYLGLFGPHPFYLGMIDRSISFQDNVRQLLYSKYGTLLDAPEKIMPVGVSEQNMYNSILQAVALGKRFSKEIAEAVGVENNYVAKYLSSLVQMQVLERRESFIRNKKTNYYAVADSLLRFWYRFIFDQRDVIQNGFGEVLFRENLEGIHYNVGNSRIGRSVELDGLAEGIGKQNNHLLAVECKYRKAPFSMAMLDHMRESLSLFAQYDVIDYYLVSRSGFTEEVCAIHDPHIHLVTPEDMFQPRARKQNQ